MVIEALKKMTGEEKFQSMSLIGKKETEAIDQIQNNGMEYAVYRNTEEYFLKRGEGVVNLLVEEDRVTTAGYAA